MQRLNQQLIEILITEEIEHLVSEASRGRGFIRAGEEAYRILRQFPRGGMGSEEVVNRIVIAAAKAAVAVEPGQPQPIAA